MESASTPHTCRICSNAAGNQAFLCREKMFGTGEQFLYFQCSRCGCLQIAEIPADPTKFYPANYYSYHQPPIPRKGLKSWLAARRDLACACGKTGAGRWLAKIIPPQAEVAGLSHLCLRTDSRILDVGCGRGQLLSILHRAGFRRLKGVDPYLPADVEIGPGLRVQRQSIEEVAEQFDLIMLHHAFEHLADGRAMLTACRQRLGLSGRVLLRLPTVECTAWEQYQANWVGLDAPRHYFLHTRASLKLLAESAGLTAIDSWCDSTEFQFWASELYVRGVPLIDAKGRTAAPEAHFSAAQLRCFRESASRANAANRGDQLALVLVSSASA